MIIPYQRPKIGPGCSQMCSRLSFPAPGQSEATVSFAEDTGFFNGDHYAAVADVPPTENAFEVQALGSCWNAQLIAAGRYRLWTIRARYDTKRQAHAPDAEAWVILREVMTIFTIGFTKKSARKFFETPQECGTKRVVDVRLSPAHVHCNFATSVTDDQFAPAMEGGQFHDQRAKHALGLLGVTMGQEEPGRRFL